jgi:SAM-dependent methyltransferase
VPRQLRQIHRCDRDITFPIEDLTTGVLATAAVLPGEFPIAVQNVKLSRRPAINASPIRHTERSHSSVRRDLRRIRDEPRGCRQDHGANLRRVWNLATEAPDATTHPVLDIGGGTGRNTLAVARRGHPVDVVEMTPKFADIIRADVEKESLDVRVIQRDVFSTDEDLRRDYRLILLSEVVSDFRTTQQLRAVFELATQCLAASGRLVFNIFLPRPGYTPDAAAVELGQQCYTTIFTQQQLSAASSGLPLQLVSDDSVYEYEKAHLPEGAWPPTSWYADWVSGRDVFDLPREECPIEMRWLVFQKPAW